MEQMIEATVSKIAQGSSRGAVAVAPFSQHLAE
jgi:hypothetical protein